MITGFISKNDLMQGNCKSVSAFLKAGIYYESYFRNKIRKLRIKNSERLKLEGSKIYFSNFHIPVYIEFLSEQSEFGKLNLFIHRNFSKLFLSDSENYNVNCHSALKIVAHRKPIELLINATKLNHLEETMITILPDSKALVSLLAKADTNIPKSLIFVDVTYGDFTIKRKHLLEECGWEIISFVQQDFKYFQFIIDLILQKVSDGASVILLYKCNLEQIL